MAPPITNSVDINVTLTGAAPEKFGFGRAIGIFDHSVTANRQDGPYFSLQEMIDAGFTSGAEPEVNAWGSAVFGQENGVDSVVVGRIDAGDADATATMTAVEAADPGGWYITNYEERVEADILLVAAYIQTTGSGETPKIYIAQSSDAALLAGTAGNVGEDLQTAGQTRTGLIYHRYDDSLAGGIPSDGYLDGAWSSYGGGFNLDAPNGAGTWKFNELSNVTFDPVTGAEATAIWNVNANLYGRNGGLSFTQNGTMAEGSASAPRFIDVTTSLDWLKKRIEEAILGAFVGAKTKIPFTDAGINMIRQVVIGVYDQGVSYGHLSPDFPRVIDLPNAADISTANKQARLLVGTGNVVLAGAVHAAQLNINVQQ